MVDDEDTLSKYLYESMILSEQIQNTRTSTITNLLYNVIVDIFNDQQNQIFIKSKKEEKTTERNESQIYSSASEFC